MNINEKLIDIQSRLNAPKGQYNNFGGYNYRSCEDILTAVKPLLNEHKLSITLIDNIEVVGSRYYIKATATVSDGENSISTSAYAREEESKRGMDGSQVTGASSSYARKYALNGLFAIDDSKDSDSTNDCSRDNPKGKKASKEKAEDNPQNRPKEYKCAYCGKPFEGFTAKSTGKVFTAGQAYHFSKEKYGGVAYCCTACAKKAGAKPIEKQEENNNA